jgi:hypothetical protein
VYHVCGHQQTESRHLASLYKPRTLGFWFQHPMLQEEYQYSKGVHLHGFL